MAAAIYTSRTLAATRLANSLRQATSVASGVVIRSSLPTRPMKLGGSNNAVAGINLTDAELVQIQPLPTLSGTVTIGDSSQTGDITFFNGHLGRREYPGRAVGHRAGEDRARRWRGAVQC